MQVANKRLLGTKSHKNTHLLTNIVLLTWGVYYDTDAQRIQCSRKHKKLLAKLFSRSKVIDCVGELLSRRWNAWHSERYCVSKLAVTGIKVMVDTMHLSCELRLTFRRKKNNKQTYIHINKQTSKQANK
jgi:hypothetical protein